MHKKKNRNLGRKNITQAFFFADVVTQWLQRSSHTFSLYHLWKSDTPLLWLVTTMLQAEWGILIWSYITLLQGIFSRVEEVGSVWSPDPLVLGGLVLLLVVKLWPAGERKWGCNAEIFIMLRRNDCAVQEPYISDVLVGLLGSTDLMSLRVHVDLGFALLIHLFVF